MDSHDPQSNSSDIRGGFVIACVCDIRGFTEMTAIIDSVIFSRQVSPGHKNSLLTGYKELVEITRAEALRALVAGFHRHAFSPPLKCAVNGTGDGFLIAFDASSPEKSNLSNIETQNRIATLSFLGLVKLILESFTGSGTFRTLIDSFLLDWNGLLGLARARRSHRPPTYYDKLAPMRRANTGGWRILYPDYLRMAGAIALGTGQFSDMKCGDKNITDILNKVTNDQFDFRADVFGHGVNLAFRLCERAGRKEELTFGPRLDDTPYLLLDRRMGQLLIPQGETRGYPETSGVYRIPNRGKEELAFSRVRFTDPLKGLEEQWCYGVTLVKKRRTMNKIGKRSRTPKK